MVRTLKVNLLLLALIVSSVATAQIGIGAGPSFMMEFGNNKPFYGLHLKVEKPRNNDVVFYGRATYLFNQNKRTELEPLSAVAIDPNLVPNTISVDFKQVSSIGYFMIDGGTRYYLINGFDDGFSLYGGTNLGLIVNMVKYGYEFGDYDASKYTLYAGDFQESRDKGSIIRLAVGFTGGVKYTKPGIGSFYLDINPHLTIFGIPSNQNIPGSIYKPVFFNFNIGYRRELYR